MSATNSTLKPIETTYKGYRMRSRLEARWATVFDSLGIRWEYEAQGFDLDGTPYLPDFWFPDRKMHVEIKPLIVPERRLLIYMAGKISKNGWRGDLVPGIGYGTPDDGELDVANGHLYIGPFFTDLNHSNGEHGQERDGAGLGQRTVVKTSFGQISRSDVVFAWIDSGDAYGTLVEIGYALALGKPTWVAFEKAFYEKMLETVDMDSDHHYGTKPYVDMWFAGVAATKHGVFDNCRDAIERFMPTDEAMRRAQLLNKISGDTVLLIRGTPDPEHDGYSASMVHRDTLVGQRLIALHPGTPGLDVCDKNRWNPVTNGAMDAALRAGRFARFEGQQ